MEYLKNGDTNNIQKYSLKKITIKNDGCSVKDEQFSV